ncbi:hypothetical protein [Actinomycetospora flava]|uniref:Uncharacterized protein n=1 Tax=Actinomycetospora flava TaxID=3129232 RepID=A0ABU8M507_9PSEU
MNSEGFDVDAEFAQSCDLSLDERVRYGWVLADQVRDRYKPRSLLAI